MELSLAVNNSLIALAQSHVFCTEPFRIPFAGKVDIACFDKTGTLTAENLLVEGVSGLTGSDKKVLIKPAEVPKETIWVLASAHALVMLEDGLIGDPMEKNTLESVEWELSKDELLTPKLANSESSSSSRKSPAQKIKVLRRFQFSSVLKRMATISVLTEANRPDRYFVAVKGAPETLRSMYKEIPKEYDDVYKYWARRGSRVLALGYKFLEGAMSNKVRSRFFFMFYFSLTTICFFKIKDLHRDDVESELIFAGFLIFFCPLKADSTKAIQMLNNSSHRVSTFC